MALKNLFKETKELLGDEFRSKSAISPTGFSNGDEGLLQTEATTSSQATLNNEPIVKENPLLDECVIVCQILPNLNSPQIVHIKQVNSQYSN